MRRIKQISVKGLFGVFDHVIPLNMEDQITIIHGPNGFGKTVILRLLDEIFSPKGLPEIWAGSLLSIIPFHELRIDFEDGFSFWIIKHPKEFLEELYTPGAPDSKDALIYISTVAFRDSNHITEEQECTFYQEARKYYDDQIDFYLLQGEEPDWLREIRRSVQIHFIGTQRLTEPTQKIEQSKKPQAAHPTVLRCSQELVQIIETKLAESVKLSQSLDRTFPNRILRPKAQRTILTDDELMAKLASLEHKRSRLIHAGLLDQDNTPLLQVSDQIDSSTKATLSIYIEDTEKKLAIFDDILSRIEVLLNSINKRFSYKKLAISKEQGFVITNTEQTRLYPTVLSHGEQHELILFYKFLFNTAPGSLILIDEPEISLHVAWQVEFLRDLQEVIKVADLDVLIATHSPEIIHDRWDLTVALEGPSE